MINERGGIVRRLLLLGLLGWGGYYLYRRHPAGMDLQRFGGQLESAVAQELTGAGITDRDVLAQVRKEHNVWILKWVETHRTLQVDHPKQAADVVAGLERVSKRLGCSFSLTSSGSTRRIEIKRYFLLLQRITLSITDVSKTSSPYQKAPQVAFVIDDVAYETQSMDRFAALGVPLTFAILPRDKQSAPLARKAKAMNFAVMLHLPMEPLDMEHNNPGPSGLYLKMSDDELKSQFEKNVASVPHMVGINNHMGSAFTENEPKMTLVMEWVKKKGLYFLDSRTSGRSVVRKVAKRVGVPCLVNETFLDNKDDVASIEHQLDLVMKLAVKEGRTIAIGHYRRKYLVQALQNKLPEFNARGIQIVTLPTFFQR